MTHKHHTLNHATVVQCAAHNIHVYKCTCTVCVHMQYTHMHTIDTIHDTSSMQIEFLRNVMDMIVHKHTYIETEGKIKAHTEQLCLASRCLAWKSTVLVSKKARTLYNVFGCVCRPTLWANAFTFKSKLVYTSFPKGSLLEIHVNVFIIGDECIYHWR